MRKKSERPFVVLGLREVYHELGDFEFRVVLDERTFQSCHGSTAALFDSDGKRRELRTREWGRKLVCGFTFDETYPDGVSRVELELRDARARPVTARLTFWSVK